MIRRGLGFFSLVLTILGLELSTEGLSLILARLRAGFTALFAGVEFHVAPARFLVGLLFLLVGLVLWGLLVWSGRAQTAVAAVGTTCPDCGGATQRVKRRGWQKLLSALLGERLTRRRCEICGWVGLSLRH